MRYNDTVVVDELTDKWTDRWKVTEDFTYACAFNNLESCSQGKPAALWVNQIGMLL